MQEVIEQLREARATKTEQDIVFQRETAHLKNQIERLQQEAATAASSRQRLERLEIELDVIRTKHATELATRQGLEQRLRDMEKSRTKLIQEVDQLRAGAQVSDAVKLDATKVAALESENAELAASIDRLQLRNQKLEEELELMRREKDDLNYTIRDKDTKLKEQASTAERSLRDYIAETDGDRGMPIQVNNIHYRTDELEQLC